MNTLRPLAAAAALLALAAAGAFSPYAVSIPSLQPGPLAAGDPFRMLDAPQGGGNGQGATHTYTLGSGGSAVLELGVSAVNGPGTDLVVYENPFFVIGQGTTAWIECAYVEVSTNALQWARFPTRYTGGVGPFVDGPLFLGNLPNGYRGLAGVLPAAANPLVGVDPFDVVGGGGDAFDLDDLASHPAVLAQQVDLDDIRFVRLIDVWAGVDLDSAGTPIWDCGSPGFAACDIDAIAALNNVASISGTAGRPWVDLRIQQFAGFDYLILELGDPDGLWTIETSITASGDGFVVSFWDLLHLFGLLQVDFQQATLVAGPIPPNLYPVQLKIAVVDPTGRRGGDALHLP